MLSDLHVGPAEGLQIWKGTVGIENINISHMPGSFHLSFFLSFVDEVTKISCHFQAKTVQLIFSFFVKMATNEKRKMK